MVVVTNIEERAFLHNIRCAGRDVQDLLNVSENAMRLRSMGLSNLANHLEQMGDDAQGLVDTINALIGEEPQNEPDDHVIPFVPYYSQVGNQYKNNCGQACVRSMWGLHRIRNGVANPEGVSVDFIKALSMPPDKVNSTSLTKDLVNAADLLTRRYLDMPPFRLVSTNGADIRLTPERIRVEINAGRPCIQLINYEHVSNGWDPNFKAGHFVLVVGYSDDGYCVHDPYWPSEKLGAYHWIDRAEFETAITKGGKWFGVPYQGCVWIP